MGPNSARCVLWRVFLSVPVPFFPSVPALVRVAGVTMLCLLASVLSRFASLLVPLLCALQGGSLALWRQGEGEARTGQTLDGSLRA